MMRLPEKKMQCIHIISVVFEIYNTLLKHYACIQNPINCNFNEFSQKLINDLETLSSKYHFQFNRAMSIQLKIYDPKGNLLNEPIQNMAYIYTVTVKINEISKYANNSVQAEKDWEVW